MKLTGSTNKCMACDSSGCSAYFYILFSFFCHMASDGGRTKKKHTQRFDEEIKWIMIHKLHHSSFSHRSSSNERDVEFSRRFQKVFGHTHVVCASAFWNWTHFSISGIYRKFLSDSNSNFRRSCCQHSNCFACNMHCNNAFVCES